MSTLKARFERKWFERVSIWSEVKDGVYNDDDEEEANAEECCYDEEIDDEEDEDDYDIEEQQCDSSKRTTTTHRCGERDEHQPQQRINNDNGSKKPSSINDPVAWYYEAQWSKYEARRVGSGGTENEDPDFLFSDGKQKRPGSREKQY